VWGAGASRSEEEQQGSGGVPPSAASIGVAEKNTETLKVVQLENINITII